jgi:hypothetical protein
VVAHLLGVRVLTGAQHVEKVTLGHDPRAGSLGVDDDRGADLASGHQAGGFAKRVSRADREDRRAHPVPYLHPSLLLVVPIGAIVLRRVRIRHLLQT